MTARIPPVVAALAAALDAHEWRLAGRYNIEKGREVQRRSIAALQATTIAREDLLRETALSALPDAIVNLAWLADKYAAGALAPLAEGPRARRAAAYLRWCVRRLRDEEAGDGLTDKDRAAGFRWWQRGSIMYLSAPGPKTSLAIVAPSGWAHEPIGTATVGVGGKETGRAGQRAVCAALREAGALT